MFLEMIGRGSGLHKKGDPVIEKFHFQLFLDWVFFIPIQIRSIRVFIYMSAFLETEGNNSVRQVRYCGNFFFNFKIVRVTSITFFWWILWEKWYLGNFPIDLNEVCKCYVEFFFPIKIKPKKIKISSKKMSKNCFWIFILSLYSFLFFHVQVIYYYFFLFEKKTLLSLLVTVTAYSSLDINFWGQTRP